MITVHAGLLAIFDLAEHPGWSLGILSLGFAALVFAARRLQRRATPPGTVGILIVALLLRVLLLPLPPTLSDDLLRYVWDGKVATAGFNPYLSAPEAEELTPLRDELWQELPHRDIATVYPPMALTVFSISAWSPAPLSILKVLLCLADLGTCWLLLVIAKATSLSPSRALWYAWNPLVSLEVAGMGHVDALGGFAVAAVVALLLARPKRPLAAAAMAAAGALTKLVPLAALPLWTRHSGHPWRFFAAAAALLAAAGLLVLWLAGGLPPGLQTYGLSWEFNGPVYEPLWRFFDRLGLAEVLKVLIDAYRLRTEEWEAGNWLYPYLYPRLLAKILLAGGMVVAVALSFRDHDLAAGTRRLFGRLLLCSATLYPWYLIWVLPWAALHQRRAWLVLSATIPLSYLPQLTAVPFFPWIFLAIWTPFWILLFFDRS